MRNSLCCISYNLESVIRASVSFISEIDLRWNYIYYVGIDVAKIAHFPDHVVQEAKRRIDIMEGVKEDSNMTSDQRREIVSQGEKLISEFLEKVKQLESVSDDNELTSKFTALKNEISASSNQYLKCFMWWNIIMKCDY